MLASIRTKLHRRAGHVCLCRNSTSGSWTRDCTCFLIRQPLDRRSVQLPRAHPGLDRQTAQVPLATPMQCHGQRRPPLEHSTVTIAQLTLSVPLRTFQRTTHHRQRSMSLQRTSAIHFDQSHHDKVRHSIHALYQAWENICRLELPLSLRNRWPTTDLSTVLEVLLTEARSATTNLSAKPWLRRPRVCQMSNSCING